MLTRKQKEKIVEDLADKIKRQKCLIFTDITGINVAQMQNLRKKLRESEVEYKAIKKTLIKLALKKEKQNLDISQFNGSLAIAFSHKDAIVPIKILTKFAKENEKFKILGGITEKKVLTLTEIKDLASIPSRDELLAILIGNLESPIVGFVNVLQGNIFGFVNLLRKLSDTNTRMVCE